MKVEGMKVKTKMVTKPCFFGPGLGLGPSKNWKMGGLGHWRHLHSSEPPPNGAPASYLSPGWHDRSPRVGKGLDRDGDLGEK